jgi:hypothetical protein
METRTDPRSVISTGRNKTTCPNIPVKSITGIKMTTPTTRPVLNSDWYLACISISEMLPRPLDVHIRRLAGPNAVDCGRVERKRSPKRATACALRAYKNHKAFYIRYDEEISDVVGQRGPTGLPVMPAAKSFPWSSTAWRWTMNICHQVPPCPMGSTQSSFPAPIQRDYVSAEPLANLAASLTTAG